MIWWAHNPDSPACKQEILIVAPRKRENVPVTTKPELKDASKLLKKGHSAGGRVLAEKSIEAKAAKRYKPKP
jgi:hypothetical protein